VISSPATYRDVQQELIVEIHRTANWPVVVTVDGNISVPEKSDFIDRDGSYIILIPDGNIEIIVAQLLGLLLGGKSEFTQIWISDAWFVLAGANEISMSQKSDVFDYFSIFKIYNCIIINQVHDIIDKGYSRRTNVSYVGIGMKLVVYTWFPYQSSDRCTEVDDITLPDI